MNKVAANPVLYPGGGPWRCFSRARALNRGQVVEDISQHGRTHEMFTFLNQMGLHTVVYLNLV